MQRNSWVILIIIVQLCALRLSSANWCSVCLHRIVVIIITDTDGLLEMFESIRVVPRMESDPAIIIMAPNKIRISPISVVQWTASIKKIALDGIAKTVAYANFWHKFKYHWSFGQPNCESLHYSYAVWSDNDVDYISLAENNSLTNCLHFVQQLSHLYEPYFCRYRTIFVLLLVR